MKIKDSQDGKLVILSSAFDSRTKILYIITFVVFTLSGLFFAKMVLSAATESIGFMILSFGVVGVYLFAGYRFINKSMQSESLFVTNNRLVVSKGGFLTNKKDSYEVADIYRFRHLDVPEATKHPLAGQSFDYLGFNARQQMANDMHGDKRLAFDYNGKTIAFGENVYSWDFEELEKLIYGITGKDITARYIIDEILQTNE